VYPGWSRTHYLSQTGQVKPIRRLFHSIEKLPLGRFELLTFSLLAERANHYATTLLKSFNLQSKKWKSIIATMSFAMLQLLLNTKLELNVNKLLNLKILT
jgi:hypothetical protein